MNYLSTQTFADKARVAVGVVLLVAAALFVQAPKASASISTCLAWQNTTHTTSRQCRTTTTNVKVVQYSDAGPNDGFCVQPLMWGSSAKFGTDWQGIGGSATETGVKDSFNYAPQDCTQTGTTSWYYTLADQNFGNPGNITVWLVGSGATGSFNTTCLGNPPAPNTVANRSTCL